MAGLQAPLSTLRRAPRDAPRMTRGHSGLLFLSCQRLSLFTLCRSPGALACFKVRIVSSPLKVYQRAKLTPAPHQTLFYHHFCLRNNVMITAKDLTKEAPRSLCHRVKGYAVLARMADKGRATINGTMGEYHFNCPLDNMLFSFKGVQAEDVKSLLGSGATDEQVAAWLDQNGIPKTADEIKAWSDSVEAIQPYQDPEQRDWFASECARLGIDPVKSRLCDYLDTDDRLSFAK